jgi:hypothetical protein
VSPPHLRTETDPASEMLWSLVFLQYWTMVKVQKLSNSECLLHGVRHTLEGFVIMILTYILGCNIETVECQLICVVKTEHFLTCIHYACWKTKRLISEPEKEQIK